MMVRNWQRYWLTPATAEHLALVRAIGYGLLFLIYLPLDDRGWTQVSPVFWMPISAFRFLSGPWTAIWASETSASSPAPQATRR